MSRLSAFSLISSQNKTTCDLWNMLKTHLFIFLSPCFHSFNKSIDHKLFSANLLSKGKGFEFWLHSCMESMSHSRSAQKLFFFSVWGPDPQMLTPEAVRIFLTIICTIFWESSPKLYPKPSKNIVKISTTTFLTVGSLNWPLYCAWNFVWAEISPGALRNYQIQTHNKAVQLKDWFSPLTLEYWMSCLLIGLFTPMVLHW